MPDVTPEQIRDGEEGKKRFLKKCFHATKEEGKPEAQRIAQCLNMWKQAVKKHRAQGNYEDPDWDKENESGPFTILP